MKIIIFGGTREGVELANVLGDKNHDVLYSLAGKTDNPRVPKNARVRIGGFGGVDNLSKYFSDNNFDFIIDATHPYAKNISNFLVEAAKNSDVKLLRLNRPSWQKNQKSDWVGFADFTSAIKQLPKGATVFITTGHKELENILSRPDCWFFIRLIEKPKITLPKNANLIISRPPYNYENELAFMQKHSITHLISKNSGSLQTRAKIDVSINLGIEIFMLKRPKLKGVEEFTDIKKLADFLLTLIA